MIIPDLNLLLYAYNPHTPQHAPAAAWWEEVINGEELIGLPHEVLFGFIRIATNQRLGEAAVPLKEARRVVDDWIDMPLARILFPSATHYSRVLGLMEQAMATGAILSDAILASYAIENRARLYTTDADFARFAGLDWENPLLSGPTT